MDQAADGRRARSRDEVAERAVALWTTLLIGLGMDKRLLVSFLLEDGGTEWLTAREAAFIRSDPPDAQERVDISWQAERLVVLLWSLGLAPMPAGDEKVHPMTFAELLPPTARGSAAEFVARAVLRPEAELFAMADEIGSLNWAAHDAEVENRPAPAGTDREILQERHRAIAWVIAAPDVAWT